MTSLASQSVYAHEVHMKPLMVDTQTRDEEQRSEPLYTIKFYSHSNHACCSLKSPTFPPSPVCVYFWKTGQVQPLGDCRNEGSMSLASASISS